MRKTRLIVKKMGLGWGGLKNMGFEVRQLRVKSWLCHRGESLWVVGNFLNDCHFL